MGIKIYYKGSLNKIESIDHIINDLVDISIKMKWKYEIIDGDLNKKKTAKMTYDYTNNKILIDGNLPLMGIIINCDPKCERISFTFDKKGNLRDLLLYANSTEGEFKTLYVCVKTQYASPEIHIAIIKLLTYLKSKYIKNLQVIDEGGYWETGNEKVLNANLNYLSSKIDMVAEILSNIEVDAENNNIVDEIERVINIKLIQSKTKVN